MQFLVPFLRPFIAKEKEKQQEIEERKKALEVQVKQIKEEILDADSDDPSVASAEEEIEPAVTRKRPAQEEQHYQSVKVANMTAQPTPSSIPLDSDHVRSFLNSLVPELNEMNSTQFKHFKRRVLLLIDDIVSEIPATPARHANEEFIM